MGNFRLIEAATGSLLATGAEDIIYERPADNVPFLLSGLISLDNLVAGDIVTVRAYVRIVAAGPLLLLPPGPVAYAGVQLIPAVPINPIMSRFGARVTIAQTAGVMRQFPYYFALEQGP